MKNTVIGLLAFLPMWLAPTSNGETEKVADNQTEIRALIDQWEKAFRAKDVNGVMAAYAPGNEVVAYDVIPPLQVTGKEAYRKNYEMFFSQYEGPLDFEMRDLKIVADKEIAFLYVLERVTGTLKKGGKSTLWVRVTSGLRKIDGKWLIIHDHVSVPADFDSGKALLDLTPK